MPPPAAKHPMEPPLTNLLERGQLIVQAALKILLPALCHSTLLQVQRVPHLIKPCAKPIVHRLPELLHFRARCAKQESSSLMVKHVVITVLSANMLTSL